MATSQTATRTTTPAELRVWRQAFLGFMQAAALVLAARMILLLAVFGAAGLALLALQGKSPIQLATVALYTITVVLPLVFLAARK